MAITTEVSRSTYTGNGATFSFSTGFRFLANIDVAVTLKPSGGSTTAQVEGVHYTLTGAGATTGTVVFTTTPATGATITITRDVPLTQLAAFSPQGPFSPSIHQDALDRSVMRDQEIARGIVDLTATVASLTAVTNAELNTRVTALETTVAGLSSATLFTGTAERTTVVPDITVSTTAVEILTYTGTAPTGGRTVSVSASASMYTGAAGTTGFNFYVTVNGGAASSTRGIFFNNTGIHANWAGSWLVSLPAGAVTIRLFCVRFTGSGTATFNADDSIAFTFQG